MEFLSEMTNKDGVSQRGKGLVYEVQHYAIHDGPGIRTLIFFKGCPLRCLWCCNPESQEARPELSFSKDKCIGCGECIKACPFKAITLKDGSMFINRELCKNCWSLDSGDFPCCAVCPSKARTTVGRWISVEEILGEVEKDRWLHKKTGGGITISGGEPLFQPGFLKELVQGLQEKWFDIAIETSGYGSWEVLYSVLPFTSLVFLDLKAIDSSTHELLTGKTNEVILRNAIKLSQVFNERKFQFDLVYRIPLVQGLTCKEEVVINILDFITSKLGGGKVEFMLYHRLGRGKYEPLGKEYSLRGLEPLSADAREVQEFKQIAKNKGLEVISY